MMAGLTKLVTRTLGGSRKSKSGGRGRARKRSAKKR
jgi:hypothetical protein